MTVISNLITILSKSLNKISLNCPYDFRHKMLFHQSPVCHMNVLLHSSALALNS